MSLCSLNCVASSSRTILPSTTPIRHYVTKAEKLKAARPVVKKVSSYVDPRFAPAPSDLKIDAIRNALYPANSFSAKSISPTGAHRPDVLERIESAIGSAQIYETIERAWKLNRRQEMARRQASMEARFKAMEAACDELDRITGGPEIPNLDAFPGAEYVAERKLSGPSIYPRYLYNDAVKAPDTFAAPKLQGKKIPPEARWKESRLEGLIPREAWVPVDRKGKAWNYEWERPSDKRD